MSLYPHPAVLESSFPPTATVGEVPLSPRLQLARIAQETALNTPGVVALWSGPFKAHATLVGSERIEGLVLAAEASGGYAMTLYLIVNMVPLYPLAETVRKRIWQAAELESLRQQLVRADVVVEDIC